jgi:hypothetical protein
MYNGLEVFAINVPEDKRARVLELMDTCVEMERKAFEEAVEKQSDPAKLDKQVQRPLLQLMTHLTLSKDRDHAAALRELNQLLNP